MVVVAQKVHNRYREQEEQKGKHQRQPHAEEGGHAHGPADGGVVLLAPVLAHQDAQARLDAEHNGHQQEHRHVGGGDGGHGVVAKLAHHKGVDEPQGKGDEVLQNHGQAKLPQAAVKAAFAV